MQQNKLYVGNLAFSATQSDVETAFSSYGELDEVRLITDRDTGRSRGFAFVTFSTQHDAESALEISFKGFRSHSEESVNSFALTFRLECFLSSIRGIPDFPR